MIRTALFILFLLATSHPSWATSSDVQAFTDGNAAYREGDYQRALEHYGSIGALHPAVEYNKGVAHYKNGRLGKAMVSLYRARRLAPGDSDIEASLAYLMSVKADRERPPEKSFIDSFVLIGGGQSLLWLSYLFLFFYLATAAGGLYYLLAAEANRRKGVVAAALFGLAGLATSVVTGAAVVRFEDESRAVAIAKKVDALSGPNEEGSEKVFTFHEGTAVTITRVEGDWAEIYLDSGLAGWAPRGALERI